MPPYGFSWVEKPLLAASAMPDSADELKWLREQGVDILLSLTEEPPPRRWVDEAGLMVVHVPVEDFAAPTQEQFDKCLETIELARRSNMAVDVHCRAGRGRTGTVVAAYYVSQGMSAEEAMQKTRSVRPGSVETPEQEQSLRELAKRLKKS